MERLKDFGIANVEHSLEHGFFWVEFKNGKSVQCCLKAKKQSEEEFYVNGPIYLPAIDAEDCGHDWGLCADANEWAAHETSSENVLGFLVEHAQEHGLEVLTS